MRSPDIHRRIFTASATPVSRRPHAGTSSQGACSENPPAISDLFRTKLADISFDDQVKDAARSINAKHALVLDYNFN